jgi:hypothetical protein
MTSRQQCALAYHCRLAFEAYHPRFAWMDPAARLSYILTVNSGYE